MIKKRPSFRDRSKAVATVTDFWRESAKLAYSMPQLQSMRGHSTTDGRIATWMRAVTSPMTQLRL